MGPPSTADAVGGSTSSGKNLAVAPDGKSKIHNGKKVVVSRKKKGEGVKNVKQENFMSKDRFSVKRLRTIADNVSLVKRGIIEAKCAFRSLLNVAPFRTPNELTYFIVGHTTLHEYKLQKNQMVFTRDMVRKVFGIRCGNKPIDLSNTGGATIDEIREFYHVGKKRTKLSAAIDNLKNCADTDEETIIRTWDLVSLSSVVAPKTSNHVNLEYVGFMANPTKN
uniref:Uncharacterized protein n=1 Tax=Avena sativa TaxID=4498 RepID=A0ACD5X000_AVESA